MSDKEHSNPLRHIIYNNNNNIPTQPTQPTQLGRSNISFWVLPNIAKGFRMYVKFTGKTLGVCVEEALLEYMKNHPIQQVTLNITKDMNSFVMDISTKLEYKLLKKDLEKRINIVARLSDSKNEIELQRQLKTLEKLIRKSLKFSSDIEIKRLLEKAEKYI